MKKGLVYLLIILGAAALIQGVIMTTHSEPVLAENTDTKNGIQDFTDENSNVLLETDNGNILIRLTPSKAPNTVKSFLSLVDKGFYNGLVFHRVIPGFVAQGGDPLGNGTGGPGYNIPAEFNSQKHLRGTLAMARSAMPDSAGSQFYIVLDPQTHLDGQYTVFGQVVEGIDNVLKIKQGDKIIKMSIVDHKGESIWYNREWFAKFKKTGEKN
jgi:peptidylprolyl isomerase/peptidyl-prolyl cis-trans isomerase B (cyclophilin B)